MLRPFVLCLLLAYGAQGEVSQGSPAEQNLNSSNDTAEDRLTKLGKDYENLTVDVLGVPALNQGSAQFKEMCETNGGNESYVRAMDAIENIKKCFSDIVSYAEVPSKIKKSKPTGELDTVFKEYCQKTDVMKKCIHDLLNNVDPCLHETQRKSKYTALNITDSIMNFVCENEGDHIALFISEKGPDCILSKQEGIKKCMQDNYQDNRTNEAFEPLSEEEVHKFNFTNEHDPGFNLTFELTHCRKAFLTRKCIVEELQTCSGSTPANVVDSIFNLVHNSTMCAKYDMKYIDPDYNRGTSLFISFFSVFIPALTVLLVRTFNS